MRKVRSGFTLIEFMVAMTLVAILSGIAMGNFMGTQKRGRDARRQSDLNQYRVALENYASVNAGVYPDATAGNGSSVDGSGIFSQTGPLDDFLDGFPGDSGGRGYYYDADGGGMTWVLRACMDAQKKVLEVCSNGRSGTINAAGCDDIESMTEVCSL